ncbi:MAG: hypothetical protein ACXQS8_09455, partial [Candidatus Helarchaeales archaeon]
AEPVVKPLQDLLFPIEIIPGERKSGELCKLIKQEWLNKAKESDQSEDLERLARSIPLEEIQRLIPAGKGDIFKPKKRR